MRVLLFSGGVESTCLAKLYEPDLCVTVDYGQVCYEGEFRAARFFAEKFELNHEVISVPMSKLGMGDMAGSPARDGARPEFWPFRNQMLVTMVAMKYFAVGVNEILIGTVKEDAVHSDGTSGFLSSMNGLLKAQAPNLYLSAPAIDLSAVELLKKSEVPESIMRLAFSCHTGPIACGCCRGCFKSAQVFEEVYG